MPQTSDLAALLIDRTTQPGRFVETTREIRFNTPAWEALLEWCQTTGLDPRSMVAGTRTIRDDFHHKVTFTAVVRDLTGQIVEGPEGALTAEQVRRVVSLAPFPAEVVTVAPVEVSYSGRAFR